MSDVTYSLKGFVGYGALADNNPDVTAVLGELSTFARTFSKDRALYSTESATAPNSTVDLTVFSSKNAAAADLAVPAPYATLLLQIAAWSYRQAGLGTFTMSADSYRQALLIEFSGKVRDVVVGAMVDNGALKLPGAVTFFINPDSLGATWDPAVRANLDESRIKLWFSDDRFRREYDEYTYEFLAPLDRLDDFFLPPATVRERVLARSFQQLTQQIRDRSAQKPFTYLRSDSFDYHDPNDATFTVATDWTYLIYGAAGDNIDAIKEELIRWILANSEHTREEWAVIFPDIFTATEFIVMAMANQFAIENSPINRGVYSPLVNWNQALAMGLEVFTGTGYNEAHIKSNLTISTMPYKSLAIVLCGGPENRLGQTRFEQHYPDYLNVSTSHPDFGRMSLETQGLVKMWEQMVAVAETMTEFSDIPSTMTRLKRTNAQGHEFLYLVKSYRDVQYLFPSFGSIQAQFPPTGYERLDVTSEGAEGMTAMPHATGGAAYSTEFVAAGGTGVYTYSLVDAAYGPILSHSIDPVTGEYTATTVATGGDANVVVRVIDSSNAVITKTFTLHVIQAT